MREIIFRGKPMQAYFADWVCGCLLEDDGKYSIYNGLKWVEVKPDTIGQFTGLHDKNGKGIYEGDIVAMMRKPEDRSGCVLTRHIVQAKSVISWDFKSLTKGVLTLIMDGHGEWDSFKFDVIGNVHDNPELAQVTSLPEKKHRKRRNDRVKVECVIKFDL